jgi:hypothetical protein
MRKTTADSFGSAILGALRTEPRNNIGTGQLPSKSPKYLYQTIVFEAQGKGFDQLRSLLKIPSTPLMAKAIQWRAPPLTNPRTMEGQEVSHRFPGEDLPIEISAGQSFSQEV